MRASIFSETIERHRAWMMALNSYRDTIVHQTNIQLDRKKVRHFFLSKPFLITQSLVSENPIRLPPASNEERRSLRPLGS